MDHSVLKILSIFNNCPQSWELSREDFVQHFILVDCSSWTIRTNYRDKRKEFRFCFWRLDLKIYHGSWSETCDNSRVHSESSVLSCWWVLLKTSKLEPYLLRCGPFGPWNSHHSWRSYGLVRPSYWSTCSFGYRGCWVRTPSSFSFSWLLFRITLFVSFFGCWGAARQDRCLLGFYFALVFILLLAAIAAAILAFSGIVAVDPWLNKGRIPFSTLHVLFFLCFLFLSFCSHRRQMAS